MSADASWMLPPSQKPAPGAWVAVGAIANSAVRRVWVRNHDNVATTAAGISAVTISGPGGGVTPNKSTIGLPGFQFTRSADSVVVTVESADLLAVSAT